MITITGYWNDRDSRYRAECTEVIQQNARKTVEAINRLLTVFEDEMLISRDVCTSGWRPQSVNDATANAAKTSKHLTAEAGDVGDNATDAAGDYDRAFAQWCVKNTDILDECGLWMEDPRWCAKWNEKTQQWDYWVHLQRVPPKSGKRIYIPSNTPPKAPALEGQKSIPERIRT